MDHRTLKQLARLKFTMRQAKIGTLDLVRYSTDDVYASNMLDQAAGADTEEIVTLALELRHKRGLLNAVASRERRSFTNADGSPARYAVRETTSTKHDSKRGIVSKLFSRRKPNAS